MKLNLILKPETIKIIGELRTIAPDLRKKKAEIHEKIKLERQCTETTKQNARCKNWAAYGDESGKCKRHGGKAALLQTNEKSTGKELVERIRNVN